jgi:hypothetical protein
MVLLGCLVFSRFFRVDLLRAAAHPKKEFCSNQHAESRRQEIDPKGMPVAAQKC